MPDTDVPVDRILDPVGKFHGPRMGRDSERTPMHWTPDATGGFSEPGVEPWLPYGDAAACNVAAQARDGSSMLALTRDLIALRRGSDDLTRGAYATVPGPTPDCWVWQRGEHTLVACNMSDEPARIDSGPGQILIATDRSRDGESVSNGLELAPWTAVIVQR
jgi:glycosidase